MNNKVLSTSNLDLSSFKSHPAVFTDDWLIIGNEPLTKYHFEKCCSPTANQARHRYFSIESRLYASTEHCAPLEANSKACSLSYEFIIKESCAFIEILLKNISNDLSKPVTRSTTIWDLFELDDHLLLSLRKVQVLGLYDSSKPSLVEDPFSSLRNREFNSKFSGEYLPSWWTAYNHLKHNPESFSTQATQENAFSCMSALFLLLYRIYGPGIVYGIIVDHKGDLHTRSESAFFVPLNFEHWSTSEYFKHHWEEAPKTKN